MGFSSFVGESRGPRYEAWSAYTSAFSKVERVRKPLWVERWKAAVDADEKFDRASINAELDISHPYPSLEDFKPEDYVGVTTAADEWARIVEKSGGMKTLPSLGKQAD